MILKNRNSLGRNMVVFMLIIFASYSCKKETVAPGVQKKVINLTAKKSDWKWDEDAGHYFVLFDLPELSQEIYENGLQVGYVFLGEQGQDELQKMLPYINTYSVMDDPNNIFHYTETISCDFEFEPRRTVAFYIKTSDLVGDDAYLADYNFRVVLVW